MHDWMGWENARRRVMFQNKAIGAGARPDLHSGSGLSHEASQEPRKYILVAETGGCIISHVIRALQAASYVVDTFRSSSEALDGIQQAEPLLIIVCGTSAGDTSRMLRSASSAPILALVPDAGLGAEVDVLSALDAGADDCQVASIGEREVLQRVRVLLRRQA